MHGSPLLALQGASQGPPPRATVKGYGLTASGRHQASEQPALQQQLLPASADNAAGTGGTAVDGASRMVVVSWLVEVAEELRLQQESLHAAVGLLDRFLASSAGVPRCVLQLVAVGCVFIATKQLEVHAPCVDQLVAVAAHSFSVADLLRVERVLLDALEFKATLAAMSIATTSQQQQEQAPAHPAAAAAVAAAAAAAEYGPCPAMESVVSLAMYLTELALLDAACCAFPGSTLATAALLLAHTTLTGHCGAWQLVLTAAGMTAQQVQPAVAVLRRLHAAAVAPATAQLAELLLPVKVKFGQDCWCRMAAEVTPLDMQQQQQMW
ncbi:cyclin-like protein [Scenedesmus sp. NREL 46B-D3]|nr:cyclin-like protein [Scenedesmus sp. NREL 46B-D3]